MSESVPFLKSFILFSVFTIFSSLCFAQENQLSLKQAVQIALDNYGQIKAQKNYSLYFHRTIDAVKADQYPDLTLAAQQDYGTINNLFGPSGGFHGLNVASVGPIISQNWNAGFGSLYLANLNWDFFAFGKVKNNINVARKQYEQSLDDLNQSEFQLEIKTAAAYLNLLASMQLVKAQQANLLRTMAIQLVVRSRVLSGLNAGVDSSLANAQVSSARIIVTNAKETQAEQENSLSIYLGKKISDIELDTLFIKKTPAILDSMQDSVSTNHPILQYYRARVESSLAKVQYLRSFQYPSFTFFSVLQEKGSGFNSNYGSQNLHSYTGNYISGVSPVSGNYLVGIGLSWNLTSLATYGRQTDAQKFEAAANQNELDQTHYELVNQLKLANIRIHNALLNFNEAPLEVEASAAAYEQKTVLYKNGLATIVDLSTALYALNKAETDLEIANNNIWQAVLYQSAAKGDFAAFYNLL